MFLKSDEARLVLSYIIKNNLEKTKEAFLAKCPALAELGVLTTTQQLQACKVNGRNLSKILKD